MEPEPYTEKLVNIYDGAGCGLCVTTADGDHECSDSADIYQPLTFPAYKNEMSFGNGLYHCYNEEFVKGWVKAEHAAGRTPTDPLTRAAWKLPPELVPDETYLSVKDIMGMPDVDMGHFQAHVMERLTENGHPEAARQLFHRTKMHIQYDRRGFGYDPVVLRLLEEAMLFQEMREYFHLTFKGATVFNITLITIVNDKLFPAEAMAYYGFVAKFDKTLNIRIIVQLAKTFSYAPQVAVEHFEERLHLCRRIFYPLDITQLNAIGMKTQAISLYRRSIPFANLSIRTGNIEALHRHGLEKMARHLFNLTIATPGIFDSFTTMDLMTISKNMDKIGMTFQARLVYAHCKDEAERLYGRRVSHVDPWMRMGKLIDENVR